MIVGLTGGICSGKTEAACVLVSMGVRVLDADQISRFLTNHDTRVLAQIEEHFGSQVFTIYGALDRQSLARIVFNDDQARHDLEGILHPPILALQRANISTARSTGRPLVISAPLLIECGAYREMDTIVLVRCSPALQQTRLIERNHFTAEEAQARIAAQMPLEVKQNYAQVVIDNDGTLAEFQAKVCEVFSKLLV